MSDPLKPVRTRFAPSPTGFLHVGGIRTALFAWLMARQAGGQFILRFEDTDQAREVEGADTHIMDSLKALGLQYDEGPDIGGPYAPYRQSERLDSYKEWGQKLVEKGRAYADPYTPEEVEKFRDEAKAAKKPFLYRDHRPENPPAWDGSQPLRFKSEPKNYTWHESVLGDITTGPEAIDDFILIKSDGFPTYNFAHIIDDHLMECTHATRTQEFLPSIPRFLNLYDALELEWPIFATLPFVMGPDGKKKLSKRDGAKDVLDYIRDGYLPEALVNFMATLGWNDGTEQEIFTIEELKQKFSLDRVQKSGAVFDERRLQWMNGAHIRNLPLEQLSKKIKDGGFWSSGAKVVDEEYRLRVLALVQERLKYLAEIPALTVFFFDEPLAKDVAAMFKQPPDKQLAKLENTEIKTMLEKVLAELEPSDFSEEDLTTRLNGLLETLNTKPGILFSAIRIAVTGAPASPAIFGTLNVLGKSTSLTRLKRALSTFE